jgi:NAD(P)H dehydrogenase (quinone)
MKALIVYAHPKTKGHNTVVLGEVEKSLKRKRVAYEVLDLYKMKYDPVMHEREHYTAGNYSVSAENRKIQKRIKQSDKLIFIYPIWWYSMPAILKGFFDRVLTSRFAFRYTSKVPVGLLPDKEALVFFTTGGPRIFYTFTGNTPRRMIKRMLGFCGIKTKVCHIGGCMKLNAKKSRAIRKKVRKKMEKWLEV